MNFKRASRRLILLSAIAASCGCPSKDDDNTVAGTATKVSKGDGLSVAIERDAAASAEQPTLKRGQESKVRFETAQAKLGIQHVYENGAKGKSLFVETVGAGVGWLDYDNDGWQDLFLNQGGDPTVEDTTGQPSDKLFRSLLNVASGFQDVSSLARIEETFYGQGVTVADFDNDGFQDVYVTNVGRNTLWKNCGDGTFLEIGEASGTSDERWSTSAAWADLDCDGDLDLYVCNYCVYDPRNPDECKDRQGRDTLCNPAELMPLTDACYFNNGDGTFVDVIASAANHGLGVAEPGRSLGVAVADFTNDGWPDIYVANDTTDNFLFINDGTGSFVEEARLRGCAVDRTGGAQGSMGIAVGDYDGNGFLDLYSTHFAAESNTLYSNFGDRGFRDVTALEGLHKTTLTQLGFGTVFADFDQNGAMELLVVNGHVDHSARAQDPKMQPQLFSCREIPGSQRRQWVDISKTAGDYFEEKLVGRGVATADFDRDGDLDVVIANENSEAVILENKSELSSTPNVRLEVVGRTANRSGIGARVIAQSKTKSRIVADFSGGTSYAASHQQIAIGKLNEDETLVIQWPGGKKESLEKSMPRLLIEASEGK